MRARPWYPRRFAVVEELGRGSQGITYLARELVTGRQVVVKQLAVRDSLDWKAIELFEREGQVLKSLNHEGIPRYIDAFHEVEGDSGHERFVLVQEYVTGESSAQAALELLRTNREEENASRALITETEPAVKVTEFLPTRSAACASGELAVQNMQVSVKRFAKHVRFGVTRRGSHARAWHIEEYMVAMVLLLGLGLAAMRMYYLYVAPVMGAALVAGGLCVSLLAAGYRIWMRSKKYLAITEAEVQIPVRGWTRRIDFQRIHDVYAVRKHEVSDWEIGHVVAFELDGGKTTLRFGTGQRLQESEWMAGEIRSLIEPYRYPVE